MNTPTVVCAICGGTPTHQYINAHLCATCGPIVPVPDPARTLDALRARGTTTPSTNTLRSTQ